MIRHTHRTILLMAGFMLGGPVLMAQGLPNPLHLPDPLGITDSKGGHKESPLPAPREGNPGRHRGHRKEHRDRREDRQDERRDERREDRHEDHHGH